jgi:PAS domain S-box-containing protein
MPLSKISSFQRLSLRTRACLILAILLALVWAFIAYDLHRVREMTEESSRVETDTLARAFAEEVNSSVNSVDHTLIDLRDQWRQRGAAAFAETVARRQVFLERDLSFNVSIVDVRGNLVYTSLPSSGETVNLSDREHIRIHRERGGDGLFISKPVVGRLSQRWTIQFTRPLAQHNGGYAGVIVISVPAEYFSRFYNTIDLGADSSIALVREGGEVVARSPDPEQAMGKSLGNVPFLAPGAAPTGLYTERSSIDGVERLYGWRMLPRGRMVVVIGRSFATLYAGYHEQRKVYIVGGVSVSLLLCLIAWFLTAGMIARASAARKLAASNLKIVAEQRRIRILLENSHDAFVAIDAAGRITDWNAKAEQLFGWKSSQAIGRNLANLIVPPDLRQQYAAAFETFRAAGRFTTLNKVMETEGLAHDGRRIPVEVAVAGFSTGDGQAANAFIRDIRARKESEQLERERALTLEQTRTALQHSQRLEAVGKLTGGVAHDFNNVLQIIGGSLQLLERFASGNESAARRVDKAMQAVERGSRLSLQLLAFARRQPLQPVVTNLGKRLAGMDDLLRQAVGESVEIRTVIADGLWNTLVDPHQLESVVLNLAINSRDAMNGQGKLTLELMNQVMGEQHVAARLDVPAGEYVLLAVSDTGSGMSAEVLERAFEPFFTTKPEGQGTGLGLSMAYGFVKQSGGDIRIYSEPGQGTTFRIYLPRVHGPEAAPPPPVDQVLRGGSETILVVEDDLEVQSVVVAMLGELGYHVLQANDADSALKILESDVEIDLLFTDVVMPGLLRGPELAQQARRIHPDIAILYTSGYTREAIMHDGRLEEGVGLLSKPYRRDQLASKVRYFLSGTRSGVTAGAVAGAARPALARVPAGATPSKNIHDESTIDNMENNESSGPLAAPGDAPAAGLPRILLVEDNEDLLMLAGEMLSIMGYDCVGAASAEIALEMLAGGSFDVLLTDIGLPGMNGIELARRVALDHPQMRIIFASGYGDSADVGNSQARILKKPYNMGQLQSVLE